MALLPAVQDAVQRLGPGRPVRNVRALDDYVAWTSDRLTFTNAPLRDVLPRLNRWYDIDLRLGDTTLAAVPYTASLSQEPVETVVQLLAAAVGARVERRGATIMLRRLDGTP